MDDCESSRVRRGRGRARRRIRKRPGCGPRHRRGRGRRHGTGSRGRARSRNRARRRPRRWGRRRTGDGRWRWLLHNRVRARDVRGRAHVRRAEDGRGSHDCREPDCSLHAGRRCIAGAKAGATLALGCNRASGSLPSGAKSNGMPLPRVLLEEGPLELGGARVVRIAERGHRVAPARPLVAHAVERAELDLPVRGTPVVDVALAGVGA
jgi:hypothetical protein